MKKSIACYCYILLALTGLGAHCNKNGSPGKTGYPSLPGKAEGWLTKADQTILLEKQIGKYIRFGTAPNAYPYLDVDPTSTHQSIDGFGYTLTGAAHNSLQAPANSGISR